MSAHGDRRALLVAFLAMVALASAWYSKHGTPGAFIKIEAGKVKRELSGSYLFRTVGGDIEIGAAVVAEFANFKLATNGDVHRQSRAVATS